MKAEPAEPMRVHFGKRCAHSKNVLVWGMHLNIPPMKCTSAACDGLVREPRTKEVR